MKTDLFKKQEAILCLLAGFGHALSSPKRLKMIGLLSQGEKSVDQLAVMSGQSMAAASAHLKVLRSSGLAVSRREGRHIHYALAGENVARLWLSLRALGEELMPEVREIVRDCFENPESLSPLTMEEVLEEVRQGRVILLDLRNGDEFSTGHLPRARHIPAAELANRISEIPPGRHVLAYCRGPYCIAALNGTGMLRSAGLSAHRLPFGVPEWKAAGLPVQTDVPSTSEN